MPPQNTREGVARVTVYEAVASLVRQYVSATSSDGGWDSSFIHTKVKRSCIGHKEAKQEEKL